LKKIQEWIFICFIWIKYEKQNVKVWFIIQSCVIMIYPNFYAFYHKAKWWLDGKDNANVYLDYIWIVCYKTNVKDAYILSENNKDMKIKKLSFWNGYMDCMLNIYKSNFD